MKAIKVIITILTVILFSFLISVPVFAVEEGYYSVIEESGANSLFDSLDSETRDILSDLGIEELSEDRIFGISPRRIVETVINIVSGKLKDAFSLFFTLTVILVFQSVAQSISNEEKSTVPNITFTLLIATAAAIPAFKSITLACSQILTVSSFMLSFIPVYAFLLTSSGNITSAVNFNTLLFSASELIVQFSQTFLIPLTGILMSINIASAINPILPLNSITNTLKKTIAVILTFISTVFIGFLSFKGTVASSVDALTVRSIRTLSGSVIPFIGSAIADSYSSVLGSLKLINNCFGFLGILIVFLITAPVIIELFMYYLSIHLASVTAEMLKCDSSKLLENIAGVISVINIIVVFVSILFTVSIGIMLKTRVG